MEILHFARHRSFRWVLLAGAVMLCSLGVCLGAQGPEAWSPDPPDPAVKMPQAVSFTIPAATQAQIILPAQPSLFIGVSVPDRNGTAYEVWNLSSRQRSGRLVGPRLRNPIISPDGQYLAGLVQEGVKAGPCEVRSFRNPAILQTIQSDDGGHDFKPMGFAASQRLVTQSRAGFKTRLDVWDLKNGQRLFTIEHEQVSNVDPALSPGGRYVALASRDFVIVHDLVENQEAAALEIPKLEDQQAGARGSMEPGALAFSPDGRFLAVTCTFWDKARIVVWEAPGGNVVCDSVCQTPKPLHRPGFDWIQDGSGWVVACTLVDRESGKPFFELPELTFEDAARKVLSAQAVLLLSKPRSGRVFVRTVPLPRQQIEQALATVRAGGLASDAGLPPITKADWGQAREVLAGAGPFRGLIRPETLPASAKKPANSIALKRPALASGNAEHVIRRVLFSSPDVGQAALVNVVGPPGVRLGIAKDRPPQRVWVDRFDLLSGRGLPSIELPPVADVIDLSADGSAILAKIGEDRIDLWSIKDKLAHVCGFRPYEAEKDDGHKVAWAVFVDTAHVLTANDKGRFVLWAVPECRAIYSVRGQPEVNAHPAISPTRKHVAIPCEKGILIMDALQGQALGLLETSFLWQACLFFSPDGASLACCAQVGSGFGGMIWDMRSGNRLVEMLLPVQVPATTIDWVGKGYLVVGGEYLVELERQIVAWRYARTRDRFFSIGDPDENYWFLTPEGERLAWTALPHEAVRKTLASLPPDAMLIRPGVKVSLDVTTATGDQAIQQKVVAALTKRLQANGLIVADNQPIRLVAAVTTQAGQEMEFKTIGRLEAPERVTTTEYTARLAFETEGKVVWECLEKGSNATMMVMLKQGQTVGEVLAQGIPELGVKFLTSAPLPRYAPRPSDMIGFGFSILTPKGVENAPPPPINR